MSYKRTEITNEQIEHQLSVCENIKSALGGGHKAMVDTFGCQQNEEDSEKLRGYLAKMGYELTMDEHEAEVVILNTCAVREHAEQRVFGNLGGLTHTKKENPNQIIGVCGCMVKQEHIVEKIKKSYPLVSLVFGPDELWRFPELLKAAMDSKKRVIAPGEGLRCRGRAPPEGREGEGVAFRYERLQQLLLLLHRALHQSQRAKPPRGQHRFRGAGAGGAGL